MFQSVHKASSMVGAGMVYFLTFLAKDVTEDGNPVETFQAVANDLIGEKLKIVKCLLVK